MNWPLGYGQLSVKNHKTSYSIKLNYKHLNELRQSNLNEYQTNTKRLLQFNIMITTNANGPQKPNNQ